MRLRLRQAVLCLLIFTLGAVVAQAFAEDAADNNSLPSTTTLPKNYPVITLDGVCKPAAAKSAPSKASCKTVVTREQFEKMIASVNPRMPKFERRQVAEQYGQLLILANEATRLGLENEPRIQESLRYMRIRILAEAMNAKARRESAEVAANSTEATAYYKNNPHRFERFTVQRVFIPSEKQGVTEKLSAPDTSVTNPHQAEMKALAESIQKRAADGEDFDKLQKDVFQQAGVAGESNTKMEDISRATLSEAHAKLLDMPPGKVSPVVADSNGYYVYKVVSKRLPPFEDIKEEVRLALRDQKTADAMVRIQKGKTSKVNNAYFDRYNPPEPASTEPEDDED